MGEDQFGTWERKTATLFPPPHTVPTSPPGGGGEGGGTGGGFVVGEGGMLRT